MNPLAAPWGAEVALITYRSVRKNKRPPFPSEYLATFLIFGAFSLLADSQPAIAQVLGWGIVVATALDVLPGAAAPNFSTTVSATAQPPTAQQGAPVRPA